MVEKMTNLLDDIESAIESANPGPWVYEYYDDCSTKPHVMYERSKGKLHQICTPPHTNPITIGNMKYIALCNPSNMAKLLRVVRVAQDLGMELERALKELERVGGGMK